MRLPARLWRRDGGDAIGAPPRSRQRLAHAARVLAACLASVVAAILVSHAALAAAVLPAAVALGAALVSLRSSMTGRLAAASATVAAAFEPPVILPWTLAAICLSVLVTDYPRSAPEPDLSDLDRFLERCRRRGESASVMCLGVQADPKTISNLLRTARITDSLVVRRSRTRCEIIGLLEGADVTRERAEARFVEALHGVTPAFGWASYPADGLTVDSLLEQARRSMAKKSAVTSAPRRSPSRNPPDGLSPATLEFPGSTEPRVVDHEC